MYFFFSPDPMVGVLPPNMSFPLRREKLVGFAVFPGLLVLPLPS